MAPAPATRVPGGAAPTRLISKGSCFSAPRRAGGGKRAVLLGVGRWDGWGTENGGSSSSSEGGRLVDEDMATLRRRIREAAWAQAMEEEEEDDAEAPLPVGLTELERLHHGSYVEVVRCAVALLEALLVSTRPGLGVALLLLAMLLLGVPASLLLVCAHLIQAAASVWSR